MYDIESMEQRLKELYLEKEIEESNAHPDYEYLEYIDSEIDRLEFSLSV